MGWSRRNANPWGSGTYRWSWYCRDIWIWREPHYTTNWWRRRPEVGLAVLLVHGKVGGGGSGWVFTQANVTAGLTSSANIGGTWLLNSEHLLTETNMLAGDQAGIPTFDRNGIWKWPC